MNDVIVLGSGPSILSLNQKEIDYINECEVKIAMNKFMAFHEKARIIPSHVFYVDCYQDSVRSFLRLIIQYCIRKGIEDLNFVINKECEDEIDQQKFAELCYNVEYITHQLWNDPNNTWKKTLDEPLFHYRGSLSTVLNYISIKYPCRNIKLVGVDLNTPDHFFEEELKNLGLDYKDWTYDFARVGNRHFTALDYMGTTIFDKFDFIISNLNLTRNFLYNCNPNSLLSTRTKVPFREVAS